MTDSPFNPSLLKKWSYIAGSLNLLNELDVMKRHQYESLDCRVLYSLPGPLRCPRAFSCAQDLLVFSCNQMVVIIWSFDSVRWNHFSRLRIVFAGYFVPFLHLNPLLFHFFSSTAYTHTLVKEFNCLFE